MCGRIPASTSPGRALMAMSARIVLAEQDHGSTVAGVRIAHTDWPDRFGRPHGMTRRLTDGPRRVVHWQRAPCAGAGRRRGLLFAWAGLRACAMVNIARLITVAAQPSATSIASAFDRIARDTVQGCKAFRGRKDAQSAERRCRQSARLHVESGHWRSWKRSANAGSAAPGWEFRHISRIEPSRHSDRDRSEEHTSELQSPYVI